MFNLVLLFIILQLLVLLWFDRWMISQLQEYDKRDKAKAKFNILSYHASFNIWTKEIPFSCLKVGQHFPG